MFHQQLTAFGTVGTLLYVFPGVDVIITGTLGSGIDIVGEVLADFHHAIDKVQCEGFACELHLIGIGLNVFDGTGMHFIAIAFIGSMMTSEHNI